MSTHLNDTAAWQQLSAHAVTMNETHVRELFTADPSRALRYTADGAGVHLDYSKHRVTDETLALLFDLARERGVEQRWQQMFRGDRINSTEDRSVLHTALRLPPGETLVVDGVDVAAEVHATLNKMSAFSDRVRSGEWKGHTGKPIKNVVNIGIGGSDLGPVMAYGLIIAFFINRYINAHLGQVSGKYAPARTGTCNYDLEFV